MLGARAFPITENATRSVRIASASSPYQWRKYDGAMYFEFPKSV